VTDFREAFVLGAAFWSPRMPGWELASAVLRGERAPSEQAAARPSPTILAPTERRRAPDTVAIALQVAAEACASAGVVPSELPSVFASTHGDLAISDYMSATLAKTPELISPIRFHNSVHNAAAGYWTIATGSLKPYTAVTAFNETFGEGMLEALVQASCEATPVLLVAYDIEARGPLATMVRSQGMLGAGLVVSAHPGRGALTRMNWRTGAGGGTTAPLERNAGLAAGNAMGSCIVLFESLALATPRHIQLALSPGRALELALEFEGHGSGLAGSGGKVRDQDGAPGVNALE
jgi:hypothetical protein